MLALHDLVGKSEQQQLGQSRDLLNLDHQVAIIPAMLDHAGAQN
ncbi:MAG TPA: hypothetical protein VGB75_12705 [Jatrophihabitans sp.]